MKKFTIATIVLSLVVVIGLFVKRAQNGGRLNEHADQEKTISNEAMDKIKEAAKALDKEEQESSSDAPTVQESNQVAPPEEGMVMTEEQMIKLEEYFEKVEKNWADRMNQLFNRELGLEPKALEEYYKMREGYEQDKLDAFEDFHEEMIEKYGEAYSYKPSEEEKLFTEKVRGRYDQALIKLIGEEAYQRYLEAKDQFNRELAEVDDKDLGFIKIDF